jgi:Ca2+-binding RTX toxin-like protein
VSLNHLIRLTANPSSQAVAILDRSLADTLAMLQVFAQQENFVEQLSVAFGRTFDAAIVGSLQALLASSDPGLLPIVEIRSGTELPGANGAYDSTNDLIFISADFLAGNADNPSAIVNLLLEEMGHKFDRMLNGAIDSPGDEGAIFAAIVQGQVFLPEQLAQLQREDDRRTLSIDGQSIAVELETWTGTPGNDTYTGTLDGDIASGLEGNDFLNGNGGSDDLYGNEGNDTLNGGSGYNYLDGGAGNDTLTNGDDDGYLVGGDGDDIVNGGGGYDYIEAGDGNDRVGGGGGYDYIDGGAGTNTLNGGDGDDHIKSNSASDTIDGGAGTDIFQGNYYGQTSGVTITFAANNTATTTAGGRIQNIERLGFQGTDSNDILDASLSSLDDSYPGLYGNGGNDIILGGTSSDYIYGGAGTNTLNGGNGDDDIESNSASDIIDGGAGDDIFRGYYYGQTTGVHITFAANNTATTTAGGRIQNIERLDFYGTDADDILDASLSSLNDNYSGSGLYGSDGNDTILGGTSNDYIDGGDGDDILNGGSDGNDYINGGDGNDTMTSGVGNDRFSGGAGDDTYVINVDGDLNSDTAADTHDKYI